jgi:hypothetical protein
MHQVEARDRREMTVQGKDYEDDQPDEECQQDHLKLGDCA